MSGDIQCPRCGEDLALTVEAQLPDQTDLTLSLHVEPGQLMRLDTVSGVLANWRDLQIAVGRSLDCETEVFLAGFEVVDNEFRITTRIVNKPASALEARRGETPKSGSTAEGSDIATGEAGDAHTKGHLKGNEG